MRFLFVYENVEKGQRFNKKGSRRFLNNFLFHSLQKNVKIQELMFEVMSRIVLAMTGSVLTRSSILRMEARTVAWLRS